MKNIFKCLSALTLGAFLFASCDINEVPKFNDSDAFVAFNSASVSVVETVGTVNIPVTLASLSGLSATVSIEAVDGTAKSGVNYTVTTSSVSFSENAATQNIVVDIKNIDGFTGDLKFTLKLGNTGDVNAGSENVCTVTIVDKDHPLEAILGDYNFKATDVWDDEWDYTVNVVKHPTDISKVYFYNLNSYLNSIGYSAPTYNVYEAVVNDEKTIITLPLGQDFGGYGFTLVGYDGSKYITSGNIEMEVDTETGVIVISDYFGAYSETNGLYDLCPGAVLTKIK